MPRAPPAARTPQSLALRSCEGRHLDGAYQSKSPGTGWNPVLGLFRLADLCLASRRSPRACAPEETQRVDLQSNTGRDRYDRCFSH